MTGIVLVVLVLVTLTYRWVVTTYTAAGGSYVVARENFGPVVAQVGAVALMLRLRRTYQEEAALLKAVPDREITMLRTSNAVIILVDRVDLAVLRAHTYARSLRPASLRAVHFSIDVEHARALQQAWDDMPRLNLPLEIVDCPDRRLGRAALELAERTLLAGPRDGLVTVLLPRRQYGQLLGRLLHDRTADEIAAAVSQVRGVAATIVPVDASARPGPVRRAAQASASPRG